jgi:uncharacterized protein YecE (DUF72 family)
VTSSEKKQAVLRVGTAGWSYRDWEGVVYPPDVSRSKVHPLAFLSALFDAVEVNVTFYRMISPRFCETWLTHTAHNPEFRFSVKAWRRFSHERDQTPSREEFARFISSIAPLRQAGKLGAVLLQFPWSFRRTPENRAWLLLVTEPLAELPLVIEFRHASWNHPDVFAAFRERHIAFCNVDQPGVHDALPPTEAVTAPLAYVRLHGRNKETWFDEEADRDSRYNYLYTPEELAPWLERIQHMRREANELFIITNNHYRGQAVVNALEIQAALARIPKLLPHTNFSLCRKISGRAQFFQEVWSRFLAARNGGA